MIKKELKGFNINIDDIEPNELTHGAMQELIENLIIEKEVERLEIVLNKNILDVKDRLSGIHCYMGLKLSLKPFEKDISFIIRPTNELTYDELQQENKKLKLINEEYEKLNKENGRVFKITNVQEYDIYELLNYKRYKDNWNELKEYLEICINIIKGNLIDKRAPFEHSSLLSLGAVLSKMEELEQGSDK